LQVEEVKLSGVVYKKICALENLIYKLLSQIADAVPSIQSTISKAAKQNMLEHPVGTFI